MAYIILAASLIIGYLIGSINTSVIVGKFFGIDIRKKGSGNAGATNTLRTLGTKAAIIVLLGDALKTVISILIVKLIALKIFKDEQYSILYAQYLAGLGTVLGHNFPVYFGFHGGKGIVTSITCIFMLDWKIGLIIFVVGLSLMIITRYVSLGSIVGSILYPVLVIAFNFNNKEEYVPYYIALSIVVGGLAVYRHRANFVRLIKGTESKLGSKK